MTVDRLLPTEEASEIVGLVREIAQAELAPRAAEAEAAGSFPRDAFRLLGKAGLLGLPYPEEYGGVRAAVRGVPAGAGGGRRRLDDASASGSRCTPWRATPWRLRHRGPAAALAARTWSAAGCSARTRCRRPQAGSDISGMTTRAKPAADDYDLSGAKAWISHGAQADFYTTFARTGDDPNRGIAASTCRRRPRAELRRPERKMGLTGSRRPRCNLTLCMRRTKLIGAEGDGMRIALSALDSGRLGIAACATGLAQAALDLAVAYAKDR